MLVLIADLFSLTVLGHTMVVLNSEEDAINLLQNRSSIYSDRPISPMMDASGLISALRCNDRWRTSRRLMHPWLHKQAIVSFDNSQQNEARLLLKRLIAWDTGSSELLYHEVFTALSGTLLRSIYGYHINGASDPYLGEAIQLAYNLSQASMPTNFLVNIFPSLRYVPTWLPGAGWKRVASQWREQNNNITISLKLRAIHSCIIVNYARNLGLSTEELDDYLSQIGITLFVGKIWIRQLASVQHSYLYLHMKAGAETTSNVILIFVIAMMLYPEVQQKAQTEIDEVIGDSRLPVMEDRHQLPYTNRLIQEVLRWCPVTPIGQSGPHATSDDDTYQGFRIPKGAMMAMSRDAKVYNNPETFDPDRFLDTSVPPCPVFGFGRRCCPGNHFAESSIFILITSLLAAFNIQVPTDADGRAVISVLASKDAIIL
ncbi:cytochrome P450 [Rhizoctonia solani]|nr:cytochrome P450 [Rhizoctonia solani]